MISYNHAYQLTLEHIHPLSAKTVDLISAVECIAAQDLPALVDSPSLDVSLKDGYAVHSADLSAACQESPVYLTLAGSVAAGGSWQGTSLSGQAVRVLSGAPLPRGTDAVVSEEFTQIEKAHVKVMNHAESGRNILRQGSDVKIGSLIVPVGQRLYPTTVGLLAAAGYHQVPVVRQPRVAILATGDEVLAPGQPLLQGKLYASNLFTLAAWCLRFGFEVETFVVGDDPESIRQMLITCLEGFDALLTSGGAWQGEHDLVVHILDALGWQKIYHRVRIGPGKAVGFGLFENKPVFCLPGGPPSNHMAFLLLGLPGLQKMAGVSEPGLPLCPARMAETVRGQPDWTQFIHGRLLHRNQGPLFMPLQLKSRLQMMAQTEAIVTIPEGQEELLANRKVLVQVLNT